MLGADKTFPPWECMLSLRLTITYWVCRNRNCFYPTIQILRSGSETEYDLCCSVIRSKSNKRFVADCTALADLRWCRFTKSEKVMRDTYLSVVIIIFWLYKQNYANRIILVAYYWHDIDFSHKIKEKWCYLCNKKTTHTSHTRRTQSGCRRCGGWGINSCLAIIYVRTREKATKTTHMYVDADY